LRQVLVKLVGNAIKFTETGEAVLRLEAGIPEAGALPLRVSVRDSGIGIPAAQRSMIFQHLPRQTRPPPGSTADRTRARDPPSTRGAHAGADRGARLSHPARLHRGRSGEEALQLFDGMDDYVSKPVNRDAPVKVLSRWLPEAGAA